MDKTKLFFSLMLISLNLFGNTESRNKGEMEMDKAMFSTLDTLGPFSQSLPPNILRTEFFSGKNSDFLEMISGRSRYNAVPSFGDLDGDGDFDLLVGTRFGSELIYFKNIGSPNEPNFIRVNDNENPFLDLCDITNPGCADPNLFDVDMDGDLDLISSAARFENQSTIYFIAYCENIGNVASPNFVYRGEGENPFYDVDIGNLHRPALVDLDNDGDWDIATGTDSDVKEIAYFENEGSNQNPQFVEKLGSQNPFQDFEEDDARPNFMDMDGDGDLDLVTSVSVGSYVYDGTYLYMENVGNSQIPQFEFPDETEPIILYMELFSPTISLADLDGDNDIDLVAGSNDGMFHYYENQGDSLEGMLVQKFNQDNPFYGGLSVIKESDPILEDMDNDGDLDLISGMNPDLDGEVMRYFENIGTVSSPSFIYRFGVDNPFPEMITTNVVGITKITAGDIDNDGDLDIVAGDNTELLLFRNIGNESSPAFELIEDSNDPFGNLDDVDFSLYPTLGDLDNDGDLDLVGGRDSEFFYFRNIGSPSTPNYEEVTGADSPLDGIIVDGGDDYDTSPYLYDLDQDGDLDFISGGGKTGIGRDGFYFVENVGTPENPEFIVRTGSDNPFSNIVVNIGHRNPTVADLDDDGDLDILSGFDDGTFRLFINEGIGGPVGINNIESNLQSIFIYPNPANNSLTIEIQGELSETVEIELMDIFGRTTFNQSKLRLIKGELNETTLSIDENIAAGLYVLIIRGENWIKSTKLNIQRN